MTDALERSVAVPGRPRDARRSTGCCSRLALSFARELGAANRAQACSRATRRRSATPQGAACVARPQRPGGHRIGRAAARSWLGRPSNSPPTPADDLPSCADAARRASRRARCGDHGRTSKKPRAASPGRPRGWRRDCAPPRRVSSHRPLARRCGRNGEGRDGVCPIAKAACPSRRAARARRGWRRSDSSSTRADVAMVSIASAVGASPSGASRRVPGAPEPAATRRRHVLDRAEARRALARGVVRTVRAPWTGRARRAASSARSGAPPTVAAAPGWRGLGLVS